MKNLLKISLSSILLLNMPSSFPAAAERGGGVAVSQAEAEQKAGAESENFTILIQNKGIWGFGSYPKGSIILYKQNPEQVKTRDNKVIERILWHPEIYSTKDYWGFKIDELSSGEDGNDQGVRWFDAYSEPIEVKAGYTYKIYKKIEQRFLSKQVTSCPKQIETKESGSICYSEIKNI